MWKNEWDSLSKRIAGIIEASTFLFQTSKDDHAYSTDILRENCEATAKAVLDLRLYGIALPTQIAQALENFWTWWDHTWADDWLSQTGGRPALHAMVVLLASIRSELDHLTNDHSAITRSHVLRAFQHLQRSLLVDDGLKERWLKASDKGETACEQLGGAHLLMHGVWAFKVDATGERTDLVLGTHLAVDQDVISSAHGLVLTEWKLVREGDSPEQKRDEAKYQAARYSEGSLAGFELESERYLVLVSKHEFQRPADIVEGPTKYKVVALFLDRAKPSVTARQQR